MSWITIASWLAGTLVVMVGPIILLHELGHFVFAKLTGVRVEEFGLGFPPRLLKLWRGKGYLRIGGTRVIVPAGTRLPSGLDTGCWVDAITLRRNDGAYVLNRLTLLDRTADDLTFERKQVQDRLHICGKLIALERGTLYSLNLLPVGAFVRMTGEEDPSDPHSLAAQPKHRRLAVLAAGPLVNILVALMLLVGAYTTGYPDQWLVEVTRVEPETAAAEAGLRAGDVILAADGERIEDGLSQLRSAIRAAPEQNIELVVLRADEKLSLLATPRRKPEGHGFLGIMMAPWPDPSAVKHYGLAEALGAGVNDLATAIVMTLQVPARLAQGDITRQEARPASVVGISQIVAFSLQQSIDWGLAFPALQTGSLVSLALGLTNLLPLPALDGGRMLFVLIEAVRGRRVSPEREATIHFVGLAILVSVMILVMLQDFVNPIIPWSLLK